MGEIHVWNEPIITQQSIFVGEPQRTFTLDHFYEPGSTELEVLYNGLPAIKDYDYEELNDHTIRFKYDCQEPDIIICRITRAG